MRPSGYEPGGRRFESCRARHFTQQLTRAMVEMTAALCPILCPPLKNVGANRERGRDIVRPCRSLDRVHHSRHSLFVSVAPRWQCLKLNSRCSSACLSRPIGRGIRVGFKDANERDRVAVIELGKDLVGDAADCRNLFKESRISGRRSKEVGEQIGFRRLVMIPDPNAALPRTLWEWGVRDAS
jgi:hypothetical protein